MKQLRIPEERVGVLIGENGEVKQDFEDVTDCVLEIEGNLARIDGEPLEEMKARKAVKAIGRGFNPDKAFRIVTEKNVTLHVIDIKDYASTRNAEERLKGRVIGRDGETRRHVEKEANVDISVYGSKVALIGEPGNIQVALEAVKMLLQGSSHSTAYQYIEKNQAKISH